MKIEDGNLILTRWYSAPREAVFDAGVETSKVQQWWGCAQTTEVRSEIEPEVGGKYYHYMTLGDMGEHPLLSRFTVYDPPARLEYTTEPPQDSDKPGFNMTVTVDFTERDGGTEVRLVHAGLPDELKEIVQGGASAALEKLDGFLKASV